MISFDPAQYEPMDRQFMLSQLVVPRPIAMVSTRSADGTANIAPMSYYLPITGDPMLVGITIGLRTDGATKHTYLNAMASGDFVINVTSEALGEHIETVAMESPEDVDEFALAGWTAVEATKVSSPAIAEALARLECIVHQVVDLGTPGRLFGEVHLVIGEVVWVEYDQVICDTAGRIDPLRLGAIARLGLRSFLKAVPEGAFLLARTPWDDFDKSTVDGQGSAPTPIVRPLARDV